VKPRSADLALGIGLGSVISLGVLVVKPAR
jgi:hypothetical protein